MIPHVRRGKRITAAHQNQLIDQVNQNTDDLATRAGLDNTDGDPGGTLYVGSNEPESPVTGDIWISPL